MWVRLTFVIAGERPSESAARKKLTYNAMPPLPSLGDFVHLPSIQEEKQWGGKLLSRTFLYDVEGVTIVLELEDRVTL